MVSGASDDASAGRDSDGVRSRMRSLPVTAKIAAGMAVAAAPAMAETTVDTDTPAGEDFSLGIPGDEARRLCA